MEPLNSLGKDDQNEVQHDFLHNVTPLALVSHDTDGIINGTKISLHQDNWNDVQHEISGHVTPTGLSISNA